MVLENSDAKFKCISVYTQYAYGMDENAGAWFYTVARQKSNSVDLLARCGGNKRRQILMTEYLNFCTTKIVSGVVMWH